MGTINMLILLQRNWQSTGFKIFRVLPKIATPRPGYQRFPSSFVFDVKFGLRRKARIVAGSLRADPHGESCYSGVVPIDDVRLALFLSVLNSMKECAADCGNAFLHGKTH